jgi:hypothetical protein
MQTKTKEETKQAVIREWVAREFNAVPQEWVRIAMEHFGYWEPLPMWGTMWIVDAHLGEKFMQHSRVMAGDASEINIERIEDEQKRDEVKNAITALKEENIDWAGCAILEDYINEEMSGVHRILDKDGNATAAYIYDIADDYVVGVNGAVHLLPQNSSPLKEEFMAGTPFEIPQQMRDLAEQNIKQAHAAYEQLTDFVTKAVGAWMGAMPAGPMVAGLKEVQDRGVEIAKKNADSTFTLVEKIAKAQNFKEILTLQTQFAQDQMKAFITQTQELYKLIGEAFQKLPRG